MASRVLRRAVEWHAAVEAEVLGVVHVSDTPVALPSPKSDASQCNVLRGVCLQSKCSRPDPNAASAASPMSFTLQ